MFITFNKLLISFSIIVIALYEFNSIQTAYSFQLKIFNGFFYVNKIFIIFDFGLKINL